MAYLTQYSNSVPVVKFYIEQSLMTIGQKIEMDICVPEEGVADNHATVEAIKQPESESYRFVIQSQEEDALLDLNGENISYADLHDGDWLNIGGVEFQFTDDGIDAIKEIVESISEPLEQKQDALALVKELKDELQKELNPMTTKEFIANSRQSRRRLAF